MPFHGDHWRLTNGCGIPMGVVLWGFRTLRADEVVHKAATGILPTKKGWVKTVNPDFSGLSCWNPSKKEPNQPNFGFDHVWPKGASICSRNHWESNGSTTTQQPQGTPEFSGIFLAGTPNPMAKDLFLGPATVSHIVSLQLGHGCVLSFFFRRLWSSNIHWLGVDLI